MDAAHRILVVDDNPTNTLLLERALCKAGYDVIVATDGFDAVDMTTRQRPSLVLLDLMMPGRDGLETCKILKAQEATAGIPIIFVTAVSDSGMLVQALAVGGCDYVTKPFKIKEVLARVSVHVRLKEAEEDLTRNHAQLERLASQLAAVNEELGRQARVDPLTKLLNRRAWEESSELEHRRSERLEKTYGVVMIDLDHFKALNDTQGHAAGDDCLLQVAECIAATSRGIDIVGRYGGEEFIILCPETDAAGVRQSAERLRSAIAELVIHHGASSTVSKVTASFGVAVGGSRPPEETIKEADDALYVAKASGRNRVCSAGGSPPPKHEPFGDAEAIVPTQCTQEILPDQPIVLVVDADPATARACREHLASDGFQIREAPSTHDLMSQVRNMAPSVILMDPATPKLCGLDCVKQLKSDPRTRDIPIILLSSGVGEENVSAGSEAGAEEYLAKPFCTDELVLRVRSMILLRRKQHELVQSYRLRGEQTLFLSTLLDLCHALGTETELDTAFARVIRTIAKLSTSRCVSIMMPDETGQFLSVASSIGLDPEAEAAIRVDVDDEVVGQVFRTGTAVVINAESTDSAQEDVGHAPVFASVPLACAPVGFGGETLGVVNVSDRLGKRAFEPQELEYINLLASVAGSTVHSILSMQQREQARDAIMVSLARLAEHRDNETGRHVERVMRYCLILAKQLRTTDEFRDQIDDEFLFNLKRAAPLHDIGKVAIPDMILLKPGRLTRSEVEVMRSHAQAGADTIETAIQHAPGSAFLEMARQIAGCHHEWYNGAGYPAGIRGTAIPLSARIAAVADVYDALTSKRPYKEALSHEESLASIVKLSGCQFDPAVIEALVHSEAEVAALASELSDENAIAPAEQGHESVPELDRVGAL